MDELFVDYKEGFNNNCSQTTIDGIIQDFASKVCSAIDDELYDLELSVNNLSPKELITKIQEIRKRIF